MKNLFLPFFLFFVFPLFAQQNDRVSYGGEINDILLQNKDELPLVFDLRKTSRLSPVKTQPDGGCWASATMSSVESLFKTFDYGDFKLSDINLKLFNGFDSARSTNGNHFMATAYFTRGAGPLLSSPQTDSVFALAPETAAYITDARFLPDDSEIIKNVIINFGAVYSMIYFNKNNFDTLSCILYSQKHKINHVVDLVGWNDTMQTKNGSGVWISQNSLGNKFGDSGFFYIPYTDYNVLKFNAIWNKWIPYDSNARIYYYDTLGTYFSYGYNDSLIYGLVKYIALSDCEITKIGTSVNCNNTKIYTEIYGKFNRHTGALTDKKAVIGERICNYPGYYTFDLENPIELKKGEEFYILMRYISPGESMPMPVEEVVKGYSNPVLTSGKCFINHDIEKWPDAWFETGKDAEYDFLKFNLCIKAYCIDTGGGD